MSLPGVTTVPCYMLALFHENGLAVRVRIPAKTPILCKTKRMYNVYHSRKGYIPLHGATSTLQGIVTESKLFGKRGKVGKSFA